MTQTSNRNPGLHIGQPRNRVDGRAKVTGAATYAAEPAVDGLLYGVVLSGGIAKGRITRLDIAAASKLPGVVQVFTHENRPRTAWFDHSYQDEVAPPGSPFRPLHDGKIVYSGQPIALIVAEEFEIARYAAQLVQVEYAEESHETDLKAKRDEAHPPRGKRDGFKPPASPRGDADTAFAAGNARVEAEYSSPSEHHNPMEPHASTVIWEGGGKITVYDKTQGAQNSQSYIAGVFGLAKSDVHVIAHYVGGAFGSGLRPQYQLFLAVMAAKALERSVRVVLTRQQMFTFGHRPATVQTLALSANSYGALTSIKHEAIGQTSKFEEYMETVVNWAGLLYRCENTLFDYKLVDLDIYTPSDMRAPGATLGVFAIECAMDELSYKAGVDPLDFRLHNYSAKDQNNDKPYSSKELREAYRQGAERFGWSERRRQPRSMREGRELVGWGVATGVWEAMMQKTSARAVLSADGRLEVSTAMGDIGTGTYTILTQIAAEALGLGTDDVTTRLADSSLPTSPVEGGSWAAASAGSAVKGACDAVAKQIFTLARSMEGSPLANASIDHVEFTGGSVRLKTNPARAVTLAEIVRRHGKSIEHEFAASPDQATSKIYSQFTHSAVFAEVKVDEELNVVRVTRIVSAVAAGRIINPKTARSQIVGGIVMGLGMALQEESLPDHHYGRFMNHNFAEYHIPVNADIRDIDVIFVEEHDDKINALGVKGLGEIGIVGTAAAVANAIYHATGTRVRDLPITIDKLLV